jgi:hypothetical protein
MHSSDQTPPYASTAARSCSWARRAHPDAAHAVAETTALTGADPVVLTGDNAAAGRLAVEAGNSGFHADLLPPDRLAAVRELEAGGHKVAPVNTLPLPLACSDSVHAAESRTTDSQVTPLKPLLIRGFGVQVPGGAPVAGSRSAP